MPLFNFLRFLFFFFFLTLSGVDFVQADDLRAVYEKATDAYNRGEYAQSVELFTEATRIAPRFAPGYIGLGLALKSKGAEIDEVVYYYKMATDVDPTNAQAFEQLGRLYYAMNKFDKADKALTTALKLDPSLTGVKLTLGWLYLMAKPNPPKAILFFQEVLRKMPLANTYFGLGMAYFANNERENALGIITQLRKMKEEDLAIKLETAMRENRKVVLDAPLDEPVEDPLESQAPDAEVQEQASDDPVKPVGVKVRLREKLSVLDSH